MYRLDDWECDECGNVQATLAWDDERAARRMTTHCPECDDETQHSRLLSAPAPYTGEQARNPICYGGQYDTAGWEQAPKFPRFEGAETHRKELTKAIAQLPDNASHADVLSVHRQHYKTAPTTMDWKYHFSQPGYAEIEKERAAVTGRNKAKRKRLKALKEGRGVNMRRDKLPGDPKI